MPKAERERIIEILDEFFAGNGEDAEVAADAILEVTANRLSRVEEALRDIDARAKEWWRDGSAKDPTTRAYRARSMGMTEAGQILREALVPHPEDTGRCPTCGSDNRQYGWEKLPTSQGEPQRRTPCSDPFHGQAGS